MDENGNSDGLNDIGCMFEARLEGRPPIAFTNKAFGLEPAVKEAMGKLNNTLTTSLGRLEY